jgi:hypothetical protein
MESGMTKALPERRHHRRHVRPEEHRIASARVRPGYDVSVIDISAGGALVESGHRLMPNARVVLHLRSDQQSEIVRGHVVRCAVARLRASAVCYRGAIAFDRQLLWLAEEALSGYGVPGSETRPESTSWAGTSRGLL